MKCWQKAKAETYGILIDMKPGLGRYLVFDASAERIASKGRLGTIDTKANGDDFYRDYIS